MAVVIARMHEPGLLALEAEVREVRHDVSRAIARDARRYCPVKSGDLKRSISGPWSLMFTDRIFVNTNHWRFVEYGTPPHLIRPNTKKALHWEGALHPVKLVRHPGTEAQPFMRRALFQRRSLPTFVG